ncbi:MAG TPA: hypothetical protein PLO67_02225 [Saprospiraceae bacterium]|nr:hypothetical protein [Saprospiraceae bacterium]HPI04885.1 hypothetical protein [Saprospiraceae bacterium]
MKIVPYLLILIAPLSGCVFSKDALPSRAFHSAVIPKKETGYIPLSAPVFHPKKSELRQVETVLEKVYREKILTWTHTPALLRNYYRQYFGYLDENGDRIVFVQCFAIDMRGDDFWRTFFMRIDDGCDVVFRVKINLKTNTYSDFDMNSCG